MDPVQERTAEIRVMVQPWQKERLEKLASVGDATSEEVARIFVLGCLLADEPGTQVSLCLERIGRYAANMLARAEREPTP